MMESIAKIFEERPNQWGLRGDPYLWEDLKNYFSSFPGPCSEVEFRKEFCNQFEKLTGISIDSKEEIYVERYDLGGMSSGIICCDFWLTTALPLLIKRLCKLE